ncbi:MAG: PIN domain-containing protein [archaeon]
MRIVLDTFAWVEYFTNPKRGKVVEDYFSDNEIFTPEIVLIELSCKASKEGWAFDKCLHFIKAKSSIVSFSETLIKSVGNIYVKLKRRNQNISLADAIIYTTAILCEANVLTGDKHFRGLENVLFLD